VITPGSNVDVPNEADEADGAARSIEGLVIASTASVAVSAHSVAMAAESATVRRVDGMFADPPVVQTPPSAAT
jgi:hypothetical protein